jgi:hypothetical protein
MSEINVELDEQENNKKSLKYFILFAIKPELKDACNFMAIKLAHIVADKRKDTIKSNATGMDLETKKEISREVPNVLKLSDNPSYEDVFLGFFIGMIKDFKELWEADLKFQFIDIEVCEEDGKTVKKIMVDGKLVPHIIKKHLNTRIRFLRKDGKPCEQNFRSEF